MTFLNAVRWVKHVGLRGTQQINDSHPHALAYEIDSHELENASHFAMRIGLFSSLPTTYQPSVTQSCSRFCDGLVGTMNSWA